VAAGSNFKEMADPQARIFISYRREDSAGHVLALLPALRRHFGDRVFKDTDNIPPGEDFVRLIKRELDSCSVLLAVIGRDWLNVQDPRLKTRRLDNPDDFLRIEVSTALRSDRIRVIPVLVERSSMPSAAERRSCNSTSRPIGTRTPKPSRTCIQTSTSKRSPNTSSPNPGSMTSN
jgi:TIR domain